MSKLPMIVSKAALAELPERARAFYVELDDDRAILDIDDATDHPDVTPLRNAYARQRDEGERVSAELAALRRRAEPIVDAGWSREHFNHLRARAASEPPNVRDLRDQNAREIAELNAAIAAEVEAKDKVIAKLDRVIATRSQRAELNRQLRAVGIAEVFMPAAIALLEGQVVMVGDTPMVATEFGHRTVREHVRKWASGDEGSRFLHIGSPLHSIPVAEGGTKVAPDSFAALVAKIKAPTRSGS